MHGRRDVNTQGVTTGLLCRTSLPPNRQRRQRLSAATAYDEQRNVHILTNRCPRYESPTPATANFHS